MLCAICYHLYNFKNVKNTHAGLLLLLTVTLYHGCFSRSLNCANDAKSKSILCLPLLTKRFPLTKKNIFYNPSFLLPHISMSRTFANFYMIQFNQKLRESVTRPRSILLAFCQLVGLHSQFARCLLVENSRNLYVMFCAIWYNL